MILAYLIFFEVCTAFNEGLKAKHYSIVDAGIDNEVFAREFVTQFGPYMDFHVPVAKPWLPVFTLETLRDYFFRIFVSCN